MGCCCKCACLVLLALLGLAGYVLYGLTSLPEVPRLQSAYWGPGEPKKDDEAIRAWPIEVSEEVLADLKMRLDTPRPFVPPLEGVNFQYGFNTATLAKLLDHWRSNYDFRQRLQLLNELPHFKTQIQGLDMHFIHMRAKPKPGERTVPLLLLHGWPGSVRELYKLAKHLFASPDLSLELVIPSLPGYGFSQAAAKPGLGPAEAAVVMRNLMKRLGHERFYVHGGDWGSLIAQNLGILYPEAVLGVHTNMCMANTPMARLKIFLGSLYPPLVVDKEHQHLMYPLSQHFARLLEESGYMHLQATKPDTIGVALGQSPIGLLAYIGEKFSTWTEDRFKTMPDGEILRKFTADEIIDNVMFYWVTNSITTSMRLYAEAFSKRQMALGMDLLPVKVASACAIFPHEIIYQPPSIIREKMPNLIQATHMERGGHFAAFEEPELMSKDIISALLKMEANHEAELKKREAQKKGKKVQAEL